MQRKRGCKKKHFQVEGGVKKGLETIAHGHLNPCIDSLCSTAAPPPPLDSQGRRPARMLAYLGKEIFYSSKIGRAEVEGVGFLYSFPPPEKS